jgi:23S rRNA pseudouridine1911/1915/1917 synthase
LIPTDRPNQPDRLRHRATLISSHPLAQENDGRSNGTPTFRTGSCDVPPYLAAHSWLHTDFMPPDESDIRALLMNTSSDRDDDDPLEPDEESPSDAQSACRVHTLRSAPHADKVRLDQFITRSIENATRTKVQALVESGGVTVNGRVVLKPGRLVLPGDLVVCTIPKPPPPNVVPEPIPLEIVYEDEAIMIVNKPAGMVTHPAHGNYSGTLVNGLLYYAQSLSDERGMERAGILHRLDKGTSGLLAVAKSNAAHAFVAAQFAVHSIQREYHAIVWGGFPQSTGVIDAPIARHRSDRKKMGVSEDGKRAVTEYAVLRSYDHLSLIKLTLYTGRTHQIRVHLSHIHHPVFGDPTYGGRHIAYGQVTQHYKQFIHNLLQEMPRQALHAKTLGFIHPVTRAEVCFNSELPADMQHVIAELDRYFG